MQSAILGQKVHEARVHLFIILYIYFSLFSDVANEEGNTIIKDRLESLGRLKKSRNQTEQATALEEFLKNSKTRNFCPGKLVMKDIDTDSKNT